MNSRERVQVALSHQQTDRVPMDLGGSAVTGMHVSSVYNLRQALHLDPPDGPVKVIEPYQMLGEIKPDLMDILGVDVVPLSSPRNLFGFNNENWRTWRLFDGTPVLVPEAFNTDLEPNGDILMYPAGDRSAPASGRMPAGGFYFDSIIRQSDIEGTALNPEDNLEEFGQISASDLVYYQNETTKIYNETDKAILANFGGTSFGDIALVPAPWLKNPRGIRDITEWYISTITRHEYIYRVFERQCEIAIDNLEKIHRVVGEKVAVIFISGTDFGTQTGPFISPATYRQLYQPFHKEVNQWVHRHTTWKTFIHSCGSVRALIPDFIQAGFDILNPVQTSATGMQPQVLKALFGEQIVFWGGGVDTQHTLPFGTPEQVQAEVQERIRVFGEGGGFVFNSIHNIQARIPVENLLMLFNAVLQTTK